MRISRIPFFLFIVVILSPVPFSCSKKKKDQNTASSYYYKATIGGKAYTETATSDGNIESGSGVDGTDDVVIFADIESHLTGGNQLSIAKGTLHGYLTATQANFKSFFAPGTYSYSQDASNGIEVSWVDADNNEWSTSLGTADQTGSKFSIVSADDDADALNKYYVKVKATFNCILYDGNGNKLAVTNGEMVGDFGPLN
jgi:hypothetical protein